MNHILIVDDEEDIRDVLEMILEAEGYSVRVASNGDDALAQQRALPADVLITDIIMPEKDGITLIKMMREEFPATKIIAISGGGDPVDYQPDAITTTVYLSTAVVEGADEVMSKPFNRESIIQTVAGLLR
jgi:CheY-like chemotaxis protein